MTPSKGCVLLVEDHPATARSVKMFLEVSGYRVEVATNLSSALRLAPEIDFDVLVCDLSLPDRTGYDLMEPLSEHRCAFSAFNQIDHIARSRAVGFTEHVVKGTTPELLLAAIDRSFASSVVAQTSRFSAEL